MAVPNPPKQVIKNTPVGNINTKGSSINIRIYSVKTIANTIPMNVPKKPEAVISAIAS